MIYKVVSTGMIMFLGGFLFAVPFWLLNLVPQGGYPSIAVQVGTVVAYVLVLIAPIPLWRLLRRFPGCQAAIITIIAWEVLVIRWFCVEDDRTSVMARFLCHAIVRNILFLGSLVMLVYGGTLAWQSSRGSGTWIQRIWIVAVLGEIFVLQEFYRNGGEDSGHRNEHLLIHRTIQFDRAV